MSLGEENNINNANERNEVARSGRIQFSAGRGGAPESPSNLVGVRGWLLFLCVVLTILSPAYLLISEGSTWGQLSEITEANPALGQWVKEVSVIEVAVILFGIYAGYGLWTVRRKAVGTAKLALVANVVCALAAIFLAAFSDIDDQTQAGMYPELTKMLLRALISSGIWLTYLSVSKRVKATYRT